jgi:hypothetical protein
MKALIDEAKQYIQRDIKSKKDVFIKLCSLNFLNAMIKDKEYKKELSYAYIKPCVSKLVNFLVSKFENRNTDELYYDAQGQCMYIRCYGIQFSFHNIIVTKEISVFTNSEKNNPVEWDGIRLQPISKDLFLLAKDIHSGNMEVDQINEAFKYIIQKDK